MLAIWAIACVMMGLSKAALLSWGLGARGGLSWQASAYQVDFRCTDMHMADNA